MPILLNFSFIALGMLTLFFGSDWLVAGASKLARRFNLSPFLIGITIVAAGTSAPELFVSAYSSWSGLNDIAVGNVLGSNITNLGLILGILLIMNPITAKNLNFDLIFLGFTFLLLLLFVNFPRVHYNLEGTLSSLEGLVFVGLLVSYFVASYFIAKDKNEGSGNETEEKTPMIKLIGLILIGLVFLAFGSDFLVRGARYFASNVFGMSDRVIGLTLVAVGTSLPELLTSVVATLKKELSLSIGNLLGSCTFNILGVLGVSSLLNPINITLGYTTDFWVMVGVTALVILPALFFKRLGRFSGVLLLGTYVSYTFYLIYTVS